MYNFIFVRMAGAYKIHLHPYKLYSKLVKNILETMENIPETVKIVILVVSKSIKYLWFRGYSTEELMINAATTTAAARMERSESEQQFLIPRPEENSWGKERALDKERIIREFVELTPIMNKRRDEECVSIFLDKVIVNGVQDPGLTPFKEFLPRSAPLVDFLSIGMHFGDGWKYPSADTIHRIQKNRGLSYQMLGEVEVKEIVAQVSLPEEILEIRKWMETQHAKDQPILPTGVVSMDVEELRITHYDWMKMTRELPMTTWSEPLKSYLAKDRIPGVNNDKWTHLPCLIMIGNGTSWALMISLDLEVISEYRYRFKKMRIQTELLDLLRDLPVCVGLGVKGDVH